MEYISLPRVIICKDVNMIEKDVYDELVNVGLERVADKLICLAKKCVRFETEPLDKKDVPIGVSKIGGLPDLPETCQWPTWQNIHLSFLCQINLHDLAVYSCCNTLPSVGWLYFFYDPEQRTWGFDPKDRGSWCVIYHNGACSDLTRREYPSDEHEIYTPCCISHCETLSLPGWNDSDIENLLNDEELDCYRDFMDESISLYPNNTKHQVLGVPNSLQGDMQLECQLVANGVYCGDANAYQDSRRKTLEAGKEDWHLLFQLDSDENAEMMWGDCGRLYFWIQSQNLLKRNFAEVWMILQCG